jgi:toxin-antitoxin system PIN domain toxin
MRSLLDVNVLLALLDQAHVHHLAAKDWFVAHADLGWASCPLTQNGFVRIISQPKYPRPITALRAVNLLAAAAATPLHEFWADDVTILNPAIINPSHVHGPRQLTDVYLLALAVRCGGALVTFDESIPLSAVPGATADHLIVI